MAPPGQGFPPQLSPRPRGCSRCRWSPWPGWLFHDLEMGGEAAGQRHFEHLGTISSSSSSFKAFPGPELVSAPRWPRDVEESRQAACGRPAPSTPCAGAKAVGSDSQTPCQAGTATIHSTGDQEEGQRGGVTCARSHSPRMADWGSSPPLPEPTLFPTVGRDVSRTPRWYNILWF